MSVSDEPDSEALSQGSEPAGAAPVVDLEELAKKVFELLLQELEIENDRAGKC